MAASRLAMPQIDTIFFQVLIILCCSSKGSCLVLPAVGVALLVPVAFSSASVAWRAEGSHILSAPSVLGLHLLFPVPLDFRVRTRKQPEPNTFG
jgi:hypothetical protein